MGRTLLLLAGCILAVGECVNIKVSENSKKTRDEKPYKTPSCG